MSARRWLAGTGVLLALAGCGSSPTQPVVTTPLSALTLSPAADTLVVGGQSTFTVTALDTDSVAVANPRVAWRSGNAAVFTVTGTSSVATVHARGEGIALLTASSGGRSDTAVVMVLPAATGWFAETSNTPFQLNDVFFLADGTNGWAVGDGGRIIGTTSAGHSWGTLVSSTSYSLYGVWFTGALEGWAVGAGGTIMHTLDAGTSWARVNAATSATLYDVVFASPDTGWAVGSGGLILRTIDHGDSWQKSFPTPYNLHSVSFNALGDGWAVGDAGIIVGTHDAGEKWFVVTPAVTDRSLHVVRWRNDATANAAGDQGVMPRTVVTPDSAAWELRNAGNAYQLDGLWFTTPTTGYAVGNNGNGSVIRTDDGGVTWTPQTVTTQYSLHAVQFVDAYRGWAVGSNGTILHTVTGGEP